jgi:hypothetical protein
LLARILFSHFVMFEKPVTAYVFNCLGEFAGRFLPLAEIRQIFELQIPSSNVLFAIANLNSQRHSTLVPFMISPLRSDEPDVRYAHKDRPTTSLATASYALTGWLGYTRFARYAKESLTLEITFQPNENIILLTIGSQERRKLSEAPLPPGPGGGRRRPRRPEKKG